MEPTIHKPISELSDDDLVAIGARSPVLKRLIEEVRLERISGVYAYNRSYTRHNRS
jgi:hypothetical protein